MRVFISGASGFLGTELTRALRARGHTPVALVRRAPNENEVQWNPEQPLDPAKLADCDAIVNLTGKNIAGRWTPQFKREMAESRTHGTLTLAVAAAESYLQTGKPKVMVSASGVGYYGNRGDELLAEDDAPGTGFLADVCRHWEAANMPAADAGVRVVCLRIGVVLARNGGALKSMLPPFRLGLGGRVGSGQQYWSWITLEDVIGAMVFAVENESVRGPTNAVAPNPVTNEDFVRALGTVLRRPTIAPLPAFAVRLMLGEMGEELLLTSTRAVPAKLRAAGYVFRYTDVEQALRAELGDAVPGKSRD
jgi:uncharacterized protein